MKKFLILFFIIILCTAGYYFFIRRTNPLMYEWKSGKNYSVSIHLNKKMTIETLKSGSGFLEPLITENREDTHLFNLVIYSDDKGALENKKKNNSKIDLTLSPYNIQFLKNNFVFPFSLPQDDKKNITEWKSEYRSVLFGNVAFETFTKIMETNENQIKLDMNILSKEYENKSGEYIYKTKINGNGKSIFEKKSKIFSDIEFIFKIKTSILRNDELYQEINIEIPGNIKISELL